MSYCNDYVCCLSGIALINSVEIVKSAVEGMGLFPSMPSPLAKRSDAEATRDVWRWYHGLEQVVEEGVLCVTTQEDEP